MIDEVMTPDEFALAQEFLPLPVPTAPLDEGLLRRARGWPEW